MRVPELLAPAGSKEALHAAITAGADAVYLGLDAFNARRNASNFTLDTLEEACDHAHMRGSRVFLAMNTIILPDELEDAVEYARQAYRLGVDALIVQDIGLAASVVRSVPDLPLHISTQMNIHNAYGLEACAALGARRVTLARELSLAEIDALCQRAADLGLEIETFAHGALCVCYSGQCLMSSMIGGRSANRGLCAQACRLPYELQAYDSEGVPHACKAEGEFLLSPKDLCSIELIGDLARFGVASLKIEGRMKSPEYVASTVSVYREALDALRVGNGEGVSDPETVESYRTTLSSVFSRGFTTGYMTGDRGNDIMGYRRPNNRGQFIGRVKAIKDGRLHLGFDIPIEPGDILEFWTKRGNVTYQIPPDFEHSSKTLYLPQDDGLESVRQNDRAFRVRSAEAAFHDDALVPKIPVVGFADLCLGDPLKIGFRVATPEEVAAYISDSDGLGLSLGESAVLRSIARRLYDAPFAADASCIVSAEGDVVEAARSKTITEQEVHQHVDRMGSSPFMLLHLDIHLDEGVGLGFSQLHHVRADALAALQAALLSAYKDRRLPARITVKAVEQNRRLMDRADVSCPEICVSVTNPDCARTAKRAGATTIYVPAINYRRGQSETAGVVDGETRQAGFPKQCTLIMPSIDHDVDGDLGLGAN